MKSKRIILVSACFLAAVFVLLALFWNGEKARLYSKARNQWKQQAIAKVATLSTDKQFVEEEISRLRKASAQAVEGAWIGTNVLLMTNGEHLVYSHIDAKQDHRIHDLFLARGSNGKWYYSTFHFCVDMIVMRMDDSRPPGSIAEFTNLYFVREFDGKSDECLEKTWPIKK